MSGPRTNRRSRLAAVAAGAALLASGLVGSAGPAQAQGGQGSDALLLVPFRGQTTSVIRNGTTIEPSYISAEQTIEGNFSSTQGSDVFLYTPGSAPDGILDVRPSGSSSTTSFSPRNVNGDFTPLVGDFDGNAIDDIFWYAPGSAADSLWLFRANGTHVAKPQTVNGSFRPVVINIDGDGYDDIVWYAPGSGADSIWVFGPTGAHTNRALSISGDYHPFTGHFGNRPEGSAQDKLIWFSKTGPDYLWTFTETASVVSTTLPNVNGNFEPIVGNFQDQDQDAILWYRPGSATEVYWSFQANGSLDLLEAPQVNGLYDHAVGDYDNNGYEDIAWLNSGKGSYWKFNGGGYSTQVINTARVDTAPSVSHNPS